MRNSRKWMIAFVAIVLLTLTVSGGALAADGIEWLTNKGTTTVYKENDILFVMTSNGFSNWTEVRVTSSGFENGVYGNDAGDNWGTTNFVMVKQVNVDKSGYVKTSDLLDATPGNPNTTHAVNDVHGYINIYEKIPLVSKNVYLDYETTVREYSSGGKSYGGYLLVRYGEGSNDVGYIKTDDLKPKNTTTPDPTFDQVTINRDTWYYSGTTSNGELRNISRTGSISSRITTRPIAEFVGTDGFTYYAISYGGGTVYVRKADITGGGSGGNWGGGGSGSTTNVAYVTGGSLALRNTPNGDVIRWYPTGTAVRVTGNSSNGWTPVEIVADSSAKGYMMTKYLDFKNFSGGGIGNPGSGWGGGSGGSGTNPSQPLYATVNNPAASGYVNLRRQASSNSDILGRFNNGQQVIILTYNIDWCQVQIGNLTGYMQTSLLKIGSSTSPSPTAPPSTSNPVNAVVNNPDPTHRLNLRAQASTSSTSLGRYYNGTQVKVYERGSTWCYVEVQGIRGYMMTQYLSFDGSYNSGGGSSGGSGGGSSSVMYAVVKNPVSTQKLNLRAQPTTSSTSLGQFYNGTAVTVTRYGTEWCEVTVNGIKGYMMTMYLSFSSGTPSTSSQYAVIKNPIASQYLNLRASADINSRSLGQFYNGTSVKILEYGMTWCRVEINGIRGYMMTRYLQMV